MSQLLAGLVSIATPDHQRLEEFYTALLQQEPTMRLGDHYCEYQLPGLRLGVYGSDKPEFAAMAGAVSICVQVERLEDWLPPDQDYVIKTASHGREVELRDPDGNRLVIHEPVPALWPQLLKAD